MSEPASLPDPHALAATVLTALGLHRSMAASGESPSPRSDYAMDEARSALASLVALADGAAQLKAENADLHQRWQHDVARMGAEVNARQVAAEERVAALEAELRNAR